MKRVVLVLMIAIMTVSTAEANSNSEGRREITKMLGSSRMLVYSRVAVNINKSNRCEMKLDRLILKRGKSWKSLPLFEIKANDEAARRTTKAALVCFD
jgi:hypothetical protein